CPDANGALDATDSLRARIDTEVLDTHDRPVEFFTQTITQSTRMHGEVAEDAKLDRVVVDDTLQLGESAGGPEAEFTGSVQATIKREARINMRTGAYEPSTSTATGDVQLSGLLRLLESRFKANALARLKASADRGFAATVDTAIKD